MEANSKPHFIKRIAADGFDISSLFILFMLLNVILSNTALFATYRNHVARYQQIEQEVLRNNDRELVNEILMNDEEYQNEVFAANLHSFLIRVLIGFVGELILFLIIPLVNPNRLTLGKMMAGVMLFDEARQSRATKMQIAARFILIVLASIFIYFWMGIYSFLLYPVLRLIVILLSKKDKTLCDYLTSTMLIDKFSYSSI
ncbi:MAG: RDD family protein [Erysipelotrichaceae bacterium]|nr:RDD family protein [Erysipelotrichaceae bacterium]